MTYTTNHFSLNLPQGTSQDNIPALLRRLADNIEKMVALEIRDITFHGTQDNDGNEWPYFTVY